jgi:ribosomal protein L17
MKPRQCDINNAVISLFQHGKITCRSSRLAKAVLSKASRIITTMKKGLNDPVAHMNAIRNCCMKLAPVNNKTISETLKSHVVADAKNNKDIAGGYIRITKVQLPTSSANFRYNPGVSRLEILRRENA